jgi:hypothetical protein
VRARQGGRWLKDHWRLGRGRLVVSVGLHFTQVIVVIRLVHPTHVVHPREWMTAMTTGAGCRLLHSVDVPSLHSSTLDSTRSRGRRQTSHATGTKASKCCRTSLRSTCCRHVSRGVHLMWHRPRDREVAGSLRARCSECALDWGSVRHPVDDRLGHVSQRMSAASGGKPSCSVHGGWARGRPVTGR